MAPMTISIPGELHAILTREVPAPLREHPDCWKACQQTLDELATPDEINAVCIHEAGHFVHLVALGILLGFDEAQLVWNAPLVEHYQLFDTKDQFLPVPGSIRSPFEGRKAKYTTELMEQLARIAVAGSVFAGKYAGRPNKGTAGDIGLFHDYYRLALPTLHADPGFLKASEYLANADDAVSEILVKQPRIGELALIKAEEYKRTHFSPFLAYCSTRPTHDPNNVETDSN